MAKPNVVTNASTGMNQVDTSNKEKGKNMGNVISLKKDTSQNKKSPTAKSVTRTVPLKGYNAFNEFLVPEMRQSIDEVKENGDLDRYRKVLQECVVKQYNKGKESTLLTCLSLHFVKSSIINSKDWLIDNAKNENDSKVDVEELKKNIFNSIQVGSYTPQTLNRMVSVGADRRIYDNADKMPNGWGTLYELTRLDDKTFNSALEDGRINENMTRREASVIRYGYDTTAKKDVSLAFPKPSDQLVGKTAKEIKDSDKLTRLKKMVRVAVIYAPEIEAREFNEKLREFVEGQDNFMSDTFARTDTQKQVDQLGTASATRIVDTGIKIKDKDRESLSENTRRFLDNFVTIEKNSVNGSETQRYVDSKKVSKALLSQEGRDFIRDVLSDNEYPKVNNKKTNRLLMMFDNPDLIGAPEDKIIERFNSDEKTKLA